MLASMTGLGRGIPAVNLDKGSSVPVGFVFQLADKLAPSYITDGLCQRVVLDHILDRQALNANDLVFMDNACRELVLVISSSVVDTGMDFGNFQTSFVPVLGALLYGNGRDKSKPRILFLERGEHGSKVVVGEALSMLKIGYFTVRETPVVDKADTSERLSKNAFLLIGRIEPEFVGPPGLLAHELLALSLFLDVLSNGSQNFAIERAIMLFGDRSYLFQHGSRESNGQRLYLIFHIAILTLIWLHVKGIAHIPSPKQGTALLSP